MMLWMPIILAAVLCIAILAHTGYKLITTVGLMLIPVAVFVLGLVYLDTATVFVMLGFVVLILLLAK